MSEEKSVSPELRDFRIVCHANAKPPRGKRFVHRWPVWTWFAIANSAVVIVLAGVLAAMWSGGNSSSSRRADRIVPTQAALSQRAEVRVAVNPARSVPATTMTSSSLMPTPQPIAVKPQSAASESVVSSEAPSVADVVKLVDRGVVLVRCRNEQGREFSFGSGFLIDPAGLIATNFHVIRAASAAEAVFVDGTTIPIKGCRAWDAKRDLVILELERVPEQIEVLQVSNDTERPHAADVIAIGHPKGFRFTTTTGIISAVHTTAELPEPYRSLLQTPPDVVWIQTNAAISGGNSGGPLLSRHGEVIGINTWVATGENLGFAVDARHLQTLRQSMSPECTTLDELTGPEGRLAAMVAEFNNQRAWLVEQVKQAQSKEQAQQLLAMRHPALDFMPRLWEFAKSHSDRPVELGVLLTLCSMAALPDCPASCNETFKLVADRIATRYASEPQLARSMFLLQSSPLDHSLALLRQMGDQADNQTVRGLSLVALAIGLQYRQDENPDHNREATQMLERVIAELADVPFEGSTLGELVEPMMYELKHLSVGSRAMEITGLDADGKEFRLSDYRGQVVVIDFWADWCPHCVAMYPMERQLVQRHADKPFALLGVNCDQRPRLQRVLESKAVTWRNWADGPQGAIARQWRVEGFPTVYVIDHEGVIRYKNVRGPELERAVDTLLSKVPSSIP